MALIKLTLNLALRVVYKWRVCTCVCVYVYVCVYEREKLYKGRDVAMFSRVRENVECTSTVNRGVSRF